MKANWPTAIITALCLLLFRVGSDSIQGRGQENIAGKEPVPSYLKGYEKLYEKDPHAAAVEWFKVRLSSVYRTTTNNCLSF